MIRCAKHWRCIMNAHDMANRLRRWIGNNTIDTPGMDIVNVDDLLEEIENCEEDE